MMLQLILSSSIVLLLHLHQFVSAGNAHGTMVPTTAMTAPSTAFSTPAYIPPPMPPTTFSHSVTTNSFDPPSYLFDSDDVVYTDQNGVYEQRDCSDNKFDAEEDEYVDGSHSSSRRLLQVSVSPPLLRRLAGQLETVSSRLNAPIDLVERAVQGGTGETIADNINQDLGTIRNQIKDIATGLQQFAKRQDDADNSAPGTFSAAQTPPSEPAPSNEGEGGNNRKLLQRVSGDPEQLLEAVNLIRIQRNRLTRIRNELEQAVTGGRGSSENTENSAQNAIRDANDALGRIQTQIRTLARRFD